MLRCRIADSLGGRPTEQGLANLAGNRHPQYARILRGDVSELEHVLRTAWDMISADRRVTGGRFVVLAIVTLGILLDAPRAQLEMIKPHLASWWQRRGHDLVRDTDQVRAQGTPP